MDNETTWADVKQALDELEIAWSKFIIAFKRSQGESAFDFNDILKGFK